MRASRAERALKDTGQRIAELARLLPPPTQREIPTGRRQILKEHLMQEFTAARSAAPAEGQPTAGGPADGSPGDGSPPARRRQRLALLAAAVAASVAAASIAAAMLNHTAPRAHPGAGAHPGPAGHAVPSAAQLLAKIAHVAGMQPAPRVRDNQFEYIESKDAFTQTNVYPGGRTTTTMEKPHQRQIWLPLADLCRPGLLRDSTVGKGNIPLNDSTGRCPDRGSLNDPTYRLLQSLPTDPRALLNLIYAKTKGAGQSPDQEAFTTIGDLLRESIAPPQVSAALYRAAALIPGVTVVKDATDAIGRHGVAVAYTDRGHDRSEWIFDRNTLQMIGERDVTLPSGKVTGTTAILKRAIVDRLGEVLPGR